MAGWFPLVWVALVLWADCGCTSGDWYAGTWCCDECLPEPACRGAFTADVMYTLVWLVGGYLDGVAVTWLTLINENDEKCLTCLMNCFGCNMLDLDIMDYLPVTSGCLQAWFLVNWHLVALISAVVMVWQV